MNKRTIIEDIVVNGLIAGIYFSLSMLLHPISYGIINIRVAELLVVLALFNHRYSYGAILGCLITNIFSEMPYDIIIGTVQTVLACYLLIKVRERNIALVSSALSCGVIIGLELYLFMDYPLFVSMLSVFTSELIIMFFGYFMWKNMLHKGILKKFILR